MLTVAEIAEACGGRLHRPQEKARPSGFSIDSRTLEPGELFIALPGQRTDGHRFLAEAFARGASGALVRAEALADLPAGIGQNLIAVDDTLRALQQAARAYRDCFVGARHAVPLLVAITGSAGKTTTKELLTHILRLAGRRVYGSPGNYNSEIGLPLALLNMPAETEVGVLELALQRPGEISQLARILKPTLGLITTIGDAHLGFFRDREELAEAKWELITALSPEDLAVLNSDCPLLAERLARAPCRVLSYAIDDSRASTRASAIDDSSLEGLRFTRRGRGMPRPYTVQTRLLGRANVYNVMAAAAVAEALGVDAPTMQRAMASFEPMAHRLQLQRSERFGWLLDDSYNASPQATREALQTLARLSVPSYQKVFVFGGMLELGEHSAQAHRAIAAEIAHLKAIDRFFGLGELAAETGRTLRAEYAWPAERVKLAKSLAELVDAIARELPQQKNLVLIKGSRAMELDLLVEALL